MNTPTPSKPTPPCPFCHGNTTWISNWECEFKENDEWPADEAKARTAIAKATGVAQ